MRRAVSKVEWLRPHVVPGVPHVVFLQDADYFCKAQPQPGEVALGGSWQSATEARTKERAANYGNAVRLGGLHDVDVYYIQLPASF